MSIDVLQDRIRKLKSPIVLDFAIKPELLPTHLLAEEGSYDQAYARFCRELLGGLREQVAAVRFSFGQFALMGGSGLALLSDLTKEAAQLGYYVLLDSSDLLTPWSAERAANAFWGEHGSFSCDGLVVSPYIGSDALKPFLPYCKEQNKDLYVVVRSPNKSAAELQDLLTGSRQVHVAAMDTVSRLGEPVFGKYGYSRVCAAVSAGAPDSIRNLRMRYKYVFLLVDGLDYPSGNAKNCGFAFDRLGHGAAVCAGPSVTAAWKETESDGRDYVEQAVQAAERIKKNLSRYVTIL
ncbi:MAG: hypothetical protein ACI4PO_01925 [Faecousia sp.]